MMTMPESHLDLLESQFVTMATIGTDGLPQLTEVWFLKDGDTVAISLADDYSFATRVGAKYNSDLRQYDEPGEKRVVARIRPARVRAVDMSG